MKSSNLTAMVQYMTDSLGTEFYKKGAVGTCLGMNTASWARSILDNLTLEDANDTAFYDFYDMVVELAEDTVSWYDVDGEQRNKIEELAASEYDVAVNAQAVQILIDDSTYFRIPEWSGGGGQKWGGQPDNGEEYVEESETGQKITVFPNPFRNSFQVKYELPEEKAEIKFEVFDLLGKNVLTETVNNQVSGSKILDLGPCQGMYILRISADGKKLHQTKILCVNK